MAETTYTYSIASDTANGALVGGILQREIGLSSITIAVERVDTTGDVLSVVMKDELSGGEETTLDGLVSAHQGVNDVPDPSEVVVQEEDVKTGGHFATITTKISIPGSAGWANYDVTFPIPVGILQATFNVPDANDGDEVEFQAGPDTTIGTNSVEMAEDTNVITLAAVPAPVYVGMWVSIDGEDLGRITALTATTITTENNVSVTKATGKLVKVTVKMAPMIHLETGYPYYVGDSKIGASYVAAGKVLRLRYNNVDGVAKTFIYRFEYMY